MAEGRPVTMRVVRLRAPGAPGQLALEDADRPGPGPGEALVRVHAAAITRDELQWPVDRLPAIPSYELAGVVEQTGRGVAGVAPGDEVFALTPFDRDGVAADYAVLPADPLAARPPSLTRAESAASGRLVSVAEEPPDGGEYFTVEPNRDQLRSIARLADAGELRRPSVETFPPASAREAFARSLERGPARQGDVGRHLSAVPTRLAGITVARPCARA